MASAARVDGADNKAGGGASVHNMAAYVLREECRECDEWWQVGLPAVSDGVD